MDFDTAEATLIDLVTKHRTSKVRVSQLPGAQPRPAHSTGIAQLAFSYAPHSPFDDLPTHNATATSWVKFARNFTDAWEALDFMVLREQCGFNYTLPSDFKEVNMAPSVASKLASTSDRAYDVHAVLLPLVVQLKAPLRYQLTDVGRIVHAFCSYFEPLAPFRVVERMLRNSQTK